MRISSVSVRLLPLLLLGLASCAAPVEPPAPTALSAPTRPAVVAVPAPAQAPALPPRPAIAAAVPAVATLAYPAPPFGWTLFHHRGPGRLILSNFTYTLADVEAVVTPYADCALHPGVVPRDFKLPLNGTWVIDTPAGSDVCWKRLPAPPLPADTAASPPPPAEAEVPSAAAWNRVFTGAGQIIGGQL